MIKITKITDLNLSNKLVLIRSDMNVPIKNGKIMSDMRIRASLPTIKYALNQGARVMVASHLGRPIEGKNNDELSLQPVVNFFNEEVVNSTRLIKNYLDNDINVNPGELVILENVRFNCGELKNDEILARKYANLCDIFVMDAFGIAHRMEASIYGIINFVPIACIGLLFYKEIKNLKKIFKAPQRPMVAIIGGSKISTKFNILNTLSQITDKLIVTGGIANTFIAAHGYNIGGSIYEKNFFSQARFLSKNYNIPIPNDVIVADKCSNDAIAILKSVSDIQDNEKILDLGSSFINSIIKIIKTAKTIVWNGPIGMFELKNFRQGTVKIAHAIAESKAFTIIGGGDTIAAIESLDITDKISYISTGGGAFLKFLEDKSFPVIILLENKSMLQNIS